MVSRYETICDEHCNAAQFLHYNYMPLIAMFLDAVAQLNQLILQVVLYEMHQPCRCLLHLIAIQTVNALANLGTLMIC